MLLLFSCGLLCLLMPTALTANTCGLISGQKCNYSLVYDAFESAHIEASTTNTMAGLCVSMRREENGTASIIYNFENGTRAYEDTQTYALTDEPDVINLSFSSDPSNTYEVQIPLADYESCFVMKFTMVSIGCRLWVSDNATSDQVRVCRNGFTQVCPGSFYDTWNEELCTGSS